MKTYIVYRIDYIRHVSEPVGKLVERRRKERENNVGSLWKLAKKIYPSPPVNSLLIITPE